MNRTQREALLLLVLTTPGFIIGAWLFYLLTELGEMNAIMLAGHWFACMVAGLGWVIVLVKQPKNPTNFDERDRGIYRRALLIGYACFWLFHVTACLYLCWRYRVDRAVPVGMIMALLMVGLGIFAVVQALATIIPYLGRSRRHGP